MNSNNTSFCLLLLCLSCFLVEANYTNVFQTNFIFIQKKTSSASRCELNLKMDNLLQFFIMDIKIRTEDLISIAKLGLTEDLPMQLAGPCLQRSITLPEKFELAEGPGTVGDCLDYGAMMSSKTKNSTVICISDASWINKDNDHVKHRLGILCEERLKKVNVVISCHHQTDVYKPVYKYIAQELICNKGNIEVGQEWPIELPDRQLMMSCKAGVLGRILDGPNKATGNSNGSISQSPITGVLLVLMITCILFNFC